MALLLMGSLLTTGYPDEIRHSFLARSRGPDKFCGIIVDMIGHRHSQHKILQGKDFLFGQDGLRLFRRATRYLAHDVNFLFFRRVIDLNLEHEPVELRFRKGISAFLLEGILGR